MALERFAAFPEGNIHCLDFPGSGPTAHFLHATGMCAGTYAPFLHHLAPFMSVVASDLRGHGDTTLPPPSRLQDWDLFAGDLKAFIEKEMTPPIVALGHSFGATITFLAAARHPHLFSAVVLIDPVILPRRYLLAMDLARRLGMQHRLPLVQQARRRKRIFPSREAARRRFASGRGMFNTWKPEFVAAYLGCALHHAEDGSAGLKCDPETEALIYSSVPRNIWSLAGLLKCPVLAVRGASSDTFLPDAARALARRIPRCRAVTVPGTGHFLPMEAPGTTARIVRSWLEAVSLAGGHR